MHAAKLFVFTAASGLLSLLTQGQDIVAKRPFDVEDLFRREALAAVPSPDGEIVLYTYQPPLQARVDKFGYLHGGSMADAWLVFRKTREVRKLFTAGQEQWDCALYSWSPDSKYIALTVLGGLQFQIRVWNRATGQMRTVTQSFADSGKNLVRPAQWVSDHRLVIRTLRRPNGPIDPRLGGYAQEAVRGWAARERGLLPSASVLDTAQQSDKGKNGGQLVLVDIERETTEILVSGDIYEVLVAPNGNTLACLEVIASLRPDPEKTYPGYYTQDGLFDRAWVTIIHLSGDAKTSTTVRPTHVLLGSLSWSPDSSRIAFIDRDPYARESPNLYLYSLADERLISVVIGKDQGSRYSGSRVKWLNSRQLLTFISPGSGQAKRWHLVNDDGSVSEIRAASTIPSNITVENGRNSFLYIQDGGLWRYDIQSQAARCLTPGSSITINAVRWSSGDAFIVSATDGSRSADYVIDSAATDFKRLHLPSGQSQLTYLCFNPNTGDAVFLGRNGATKDAVILSNVFHGDHQVIAGPINAFENEIDRGKQQLIEYTSQDGRILKGSLLLPYGYQSGNRYPLVVDVYPGESYQAVDAAQNSLDMYPNSDLLLSAKGYAVLKPSMPLPPHGTPNDNYFELPKGVMPAIDKVLEMGIADPDRLALIGHSYGGYAVYGLITQTRRFRAAIAYAGAADLVSAYGQFTADLRYKDHPLTEMLFNFQLQWLEGGQAALGAPPWRDPQRYVRNSPYFYAAQAQTPILILQGDMDQVPIQQGEEFFMAMHRLNQRARFVRYWGESHDVFSPANIRDLHLQIFDWLAEHLGNETAKTSSKE